MKTGTVEKVEYTQGGAGNQWTTISGVRYATYWDIRTRDWSVGDVVSFEEQSASLWHGAAPVPHASRIHKVQS
jgi:hypothetical protein